MKLVFRNEDLQMFGLNLNKILISLIFLKLWNDTATHNVKWVKF